MNQAYKRNLLQLVQVAAKSRDTLRQSLSFSHFESDGMRHTFFDSITSHWLPMIEYTLWEGLSTGGTSQGCRESEGFLDGKVRLN